MEVPSYSSLNKTLCSKEQPFSSEEESGWTSYFEDFLASEKRKASEAATSSSCSLGLRDGSSMVSDAASCTAWKPHQIIGEPPRSCGNLSLMRKKERSVLEDDSLEDTARSPVNSPKDKMVGYAGDYKELASDGIKEPNYVGMVHKSCSELRKQGLCLVPLSMISNYPG